MEQILIRVLNMSLTAGVAILAVLLIRLLLVRAPKIFSYLLWLPVLFRLLCPVSFSMDISLTGLLKAPLFEEGELQYIPADIGFMQEPEVTLPGKMMTEMVNSSLPAGTPAASMNPMQGILFAGAVLWLAGVLLMLIFSVAACLRLRRKLKGAVIEEGQGNVYRTDQISMPFVCGLFRPVVYLPAGLAGEEKDYILLHEKIHIRRKDQLWRFLGYLALSLHWFNPLVWLAFYLSGKDMEMSCDEAVIRRMGIYIRKKYSASLLSFACGRRVMPGLPLAFGEGQTGSRIRNLLHYKKTGRAAMAVFGALCLAAAVILIANPGRGGQTEKGGGLSCYEIPVGDDQLFWGMSREELTAVFGDPSEEEANEYGTTMTYDMPIQSRLGESSQMVLYVGIRNVTDPGAPEGEKLSNGLCGIMMTLAPTTRETVLEKIEDFYGELSPEGGSTKMEAQLQQGVPSYFNEVHFCEDWRVGNLPEEEYRELAERCEINRGRKLGEDDLLMSVYLWGVEEGEAYPCVVQLDVSMMGALAYL